MQAMMIGGFVCAIAVFSAVFGFVVVYRSIWGGVDFLTHD